MWFVHVCFTGKVNGKAARDRCFRSICFGIALSFLFELGAIAQEDAEVYDFHITETELGPAIASIVRKTDKNILFPYELAGETGFNPVIGRYTLQEALNLMFQGTKFSGGLSDSGVMYITLSETSSNSDRRNDMVNSKTKKTLLSILSAIFLGNAQSDGVVAQENTGINQEQVFEEVIVTATRREGSVQDTPLSITAIGNEAIARNNFTGFESYLNTVPGVVIRDRAAGANEIIFRGITTDPTFGSFNTGSTTGLYLGETPLSGLAHFGANVDLELVDIERVEVLRGPQGTLYGASSLGGTIRYVPVAPDLNEFGGNASLTYSSTSEGGGVNTNVNAALNVPLLEDQLALRITVYQNDSGGFYTNVARDNAAHLAEAQFFGTEALAIDVDESGTRKAQGARGQILWEPSDKFSATATFVRQDVDQNGLPEQDRDLAPYLQAREQFSSEVGGGGEGSEVDTTILNLQLEYDLGWAELMSSTSRVETDTDYLREFGAILPFLGGAPFVSNDPGETESFVQELRLTSSLDGSFQFVAGVFYEDIERFSDRTLLFFGDPTTNPFPGPEGDEANLLSGTTDINSEQVAVYGEVSYDITEHLTATGGVRYFDYTRDDIRTSSGLFAGAPTDVQAAEDGTTYKANISYEANDDSLLYAQFSQGFRLGRGIGSAPTACDLDGDGRIDGTNISSGPRTLESDTIDSYELGGKFVIGDQLQVNAAVYRNIWDGIPITIVPPCQFELTQTAGKAITQGVEVELNWAVTEALLWNFAGSYLSAEIDGDNSLGSDGDRLPGTPEISVSTNIFYDFNFGNTDAYMQADVIYVDSFFNYIGETGPESDSYLTLGLRAGAYLSNNVNVQIFAENITNNDAITFDNDNTIFRLRPRTIGAKLDIDF